MDTGAVHQLTVGNRHLATDERGIGLRATWHLDRGFVNLSLWRDDRCVETFHLAPVEAGHLVSFLVGGLANTVRKPIHDSQLAAAPVPPERNQQHTGTTLLSHSWGTLRRDLADTLERAALRLRP